MRKIITLLTFLITIKCVNAQIPIGVKYDLNGMPFNGYFDPTLYSPNKKISKVYNSDSYEVGSYYNKSGDKISGMIKFQDKKIWFKEAGNEYRDKIKPEEIQDFVIGVDSFFTVSKYYYKNVLKTKPVYVQYISGFRDYTIAKHYHFRKFVVQGQSPIIESFLIKSSDGDTWENFTDNNKFKEKALKYFGHIPYLKNKISSGDYESDDMMSIIKMAEYYEKHNNSTPIFYDKYWQEVRDIKKAEYKANITSKNDSIWIFEYYKNKTKLYKGSYSSFYPNTKNGDFIAYYPNGETRQIISFSNNKPKEIKIFNKNGLLGTHYQIIENEDGYSSKVDLNIKYIVVNDSLGNNIFKEQDKSYLNIFDEQNNNQYVSTFENKELTNIYRLYKNDTLFQIVNPNYDFKIKSLQKKFDFYMLGKKYDEALSENAQGIILVSLIIDNKGYVIEGSSLNKIHPEMDKLVDKFISSRLLVGAESRHKFKPYKKDKVKQYSEVVIPFEFSINRFYRQPVNYNHFHHWHMNQMMHQQMMNTYRPPIPSF